MLLRDGCDQMEDYTYRMLGEYGTEIPALGRAREPVFGYMTGCARDDPMVNFFEPVKQTTKDAQSNVTDAVAHLALRPQIQASVASLKAEMQSIVDRLATVRTVMSCGAVYQIWTRAKTALCCDVAYSTVFLWVARLLTCVWMVPAAISAIAGYKRFRRVLWGPYATVQALEVGAYL